MYRNPKIVRTFHSRTNRDEKKKKKERRGEIKKKKSKQELAEDGSYKPLRETLTISTFRGNFPYDRNRLRVSEVESQPFALSAKDPRVFALAHQGPSTG